MPRLAAAVLVLALSAVAPPASAAPATVTEWEKTFPTTGRPALVLRAGDAGVHVTTWDRRAVGIRVSTRGWSIGPRGVTSTRGWSIGRRSVTVDASQFGDRVMCEVREPRHTVHFEFGLRTIRVEVSLPRDADVDISTGDGAITIAPLAGDIRAHTGDGTIEVEGLRGRVALTSGDGRIRATGLDGELVARSGDGGMLIEGRFDRLEVGTTDGRVAATASEGSRLATEWNLRSGDGGLTLRVPATLKADLDLRTGDGRLAVDLPVEITGRMRRHVLFGRLNGGGPVLRMRSGDGSIRLAGL